MREARYVSLIPQTTLHSDSEQYVPYITQFLLHQPSDTEKALFKPHWYCNTAHLPNDIFVVVDSVMLFINQQIFDIDFQNLNDV